jgi:hypothetical protein
MQVDQAIDFLLLILVRIDQAMDFDTVSRLSALPLLFRDMDGKYPDLDARPL